MPKNPPVTVRKNPPIEVHRRRFRRRAIPLAERIVDAARHAIADNLYPAKNLKQLRKMIVSLGENQAFWDALDSVADAAEVLGSIEMCR